MTSYSPTRRSVLRMLGGGALATTLGGSALAGTVSSSRSGHRSWLQAALADTIQPLHRSRFTAAVGTTFTARAEHGSFYLRLAEIRDLPATSAADADRSFNLLFSPVARRLPEGIYELESARAGRATLFLSPVGQAGRTMQGLVNQSS